MSRRRRLPRLEWSDLRLERRELLSATSSAGGPGRAAETGTAPENLFHHDGISGLMLHQSFVDGMNTRLSISSDQASRVTQAFEVFISNDEALPVNPPPGSTGSTLADLLSSLTSEVDHALSTREVLTNRQSPSMATAPTISRLAALALVPYANTQISQLGATLAATPPVVGSSGALQQADPTAAANTAVNAILNALAESSLHPNLFLSPSDFYISPKLTFTVNSSGAPASSSPGYFIRGPHGETLEGATLHPHVPL